MILQEFYNIKCINNILYNKQVRLVSVFKDYLIYDDVCEFMSEYYTAVESKQIFS